MSAAHEIPTHLEVADRAVLGLTMRQLLAAAIGLALAYGAWNDLPLPIALRAGAALVTVLVCAVLVLWRPGGRAAEEWVFVLVRYWSAPRVAVWRPGVSRRRARRAHEVVLPGEADGSQGEVADAA